jgi:hypothetical protein
MDIDIYMPLAFHTLIFDVYENYDDMLIEVC